MSKNESNSETGTDGDGSVTSQRPGIELLDARSAAIAVAGTVAYYLATQSFFPSVLREWGILVPFIAIYAVVNMYDV